MAGAYFLYIYLPVSILKSFHYKSSHTNSTQKDELHVPLAPNAPPPTHAPSHSQSQEQQAGRRPDREPDVHGAPVLREQARHRFRRPRPQVHERHEPLRAVEARQHPAREEAERAVRPPAAAAAATRDNRRDMGYSRAPGVYHDVSFRTPSPASQSCHPKQPKKKKKSNQLVTRCYLDNNNDKPPPPQQPKQQSNLDVAIRQRARPAGHEQIPALDRGADGRLGEGGLVLAVGDRERGVRARRLRGLRRPACEDRDAERAGEGRGAR